MMNQVSFIVVFCMGVMLGWGDFLIGAVERGLQHGIIMGYLIPIHTLWDIYFYSLCGLVIVFIISQRRSCNELPVKAT